jgi:transglutaminase-like putative cysteine protease
MLYDLDILNTTKDERMRLFFFSCIFLVFFAITAASGDVLREAKEAIIARNYGRAPLLFPGSDEAENLSARQELDLLIMQILTNAWLEKWDEAKDQANELMSILSPQPIPDSEINSFLRIILDKNGFHIPDFLSYTFTQEDMRYLNRMLWYDYIAHHIVKDLKDPLNKTIAIMDYVYRHIAFGISSERHADQYFAMQPYLVLERSEGLCNDFAWVFNTLANAAGIPAMRLVLHWDHNPDESPHTISMVKIKGRWIAVDPSYGVLLHDAETQQPDRYPKEFLIQPQEKSDVPFRLKGEEKKKYKNAIRHFGGYEHYYKTVTYSRPAIDHEWESYTPRFHVLHNTVIQTFAGLKLAYEYQYVNYPRYTPTDKTVKWFVANPSEPYSLVHEKNELRREAIHTLYPHIKPLRSGNFFLMLRSYGNAKNFYTRIRTHPEITPAALEEVDYKLALIAYETGDVDTAKDLFHTFLETYPTSNWKNPIYYQLARIYANKGNILMRDTMRAECGQDKAGSLYSWIQKRKLPIEYR